MTPVGLHPEARDDLIRAARRYADLNPLLGERFYRHIEELLVDIATRPALFRIFRPPSIRRHFKRRFPYAVVYVVRPNEVWVLAIMHFKQPPDYWIRRL